MFSFVGLAQQKEISFGSEECRLYPIPKKYKDHGKTIAIDNNSVIAIGENAEEPEKYVANWLCKMLKERHDLSIGVVNANAIPEETSLVILLGQNTTNQLVSAFLKDNGIIVSEEKLGKDGFVIRPFVKEGRQYVAGIGIHTRAVTYSGTVIYDLITRKDGKSAIHLMDIDDWAVYASRRLITFGNTDALMHGMDELMCTRYNKLKVDLKTKNTEELKKAARSIGMDVFAKIHGNIRANEIPATLESAEKALRDGYDGIYLSFDDNGMGEDYKQLLIGMEKIRVKYNLSPDRFEVTVLPYGDTPPQNLVLKEISELPGEIRNYLYTLTIVPNPVHHQDMVNNHTPNWSWWHNYSPNDAKGNGYAVIRNGAHPFTKFGAMIHPEVGWSFHNISCTYNNINRWAGLAQGAISLIPTGSKIGYNGWTFGLIGWNAGNVTWEDTKRKAWSWSYGDDATEAVETYENVILELQEIFGNSGEKAVHYGRPTPWLLKNPADDKKARKLIETGKEAAETMIKVARAQSTVSDERLEAYYLDCLIYNLNAYSILLDAPFPEKEYPNIGQELKKVFEEKGEKAFKKSLDNYTKNIKPKLAIIEKIAGDYAFLRRYLDLSKEREKPEYWLDFFEREDKKFEIDFKKEGDKIFINFNPGMMVHYTTDPDVVPGPYEACYRFKKEIVIGRDVFPGETLRVVVSETDTDEVSDIISYKVME